MLRVHINGEKALSRSEPRLFRTRNCHGPLLFGTARTTFLRFGSVPQKTWTNVRLVVVAPSAARLSTGPKISVWAIKRHATMRYHSTRTTDTHMQMSTHVSSGPHKLDVRLLLYRGCHKGESFYSSGAKQLICGFFIALLGSSSAESSPVILARFRVFERPEHAPRSPPGTQTCAVVYRLVPFVPRSRERDKRPTGAREKRANVKKNTHTLINTVVV